MVDGMSIWKGTARRCALSMAILCVAICVAGCAGRFVANAIEKGIKNKLPELIGPAKSYNVEVRGSTGQMMHGKIQEVNIQGRDVQVMPELMLDDLKIRMLDVVADPETSTLKSVGDLRFDAEVSEAALNDYLKRTRREDVRVQLYDQRMVVTARPQVLKISTTVKLTGRLVPKGHKLDFNIDRLEVAGIGAPSIATDMVRDRVNPVLDLTKMSLSPELTSAVIAPGVVKISGTAKIAAESSVGGNRGG